MVFELDYRPYTWTSAEETAVYYTLVAEQSDIVIGTRDEFDVMEIRAAAAMKNLFSIYLHIPQILSLSSTVSKVHMHTANPGTSSGRKRTNEGLETFGAGDSYASAFLYGLVSGKDIETALKYGSASASIVVSKHSSSEAMPTVAEIEELIAAQS
ncbi:PfkB family carbohydrate kinase [Bacillus licheniformis]|nr:PfkB family carbohydrate kinase [Bacillus licheniformis]